MAKEKLPKQSFNDLSSKKEPITERLYSVSLVYFKESKFGNQITQSRRLKQVFVNAVSPDEALGAAYRQLGSEMKEYMLELNLTAEVGNAVYYNINRNEK